jgi:carboxymethylenebutenolidase
MQIVTSDAELRVDDSPMRVYVAAPKPEGRYPGILLYSEIFQLTGPIRRSCERLAGHGFVVAAPEIYHRHERPGTVIPYDDIGRIWGNDGAKRTPWRRSTPTPGRRSTISPSTRRWRPASSARWASASAGTSPGAPALQPDVKGGRLLLPDGRSQRQARQDADAGTLARFGEIKGEMLLVFGDADPHVPREGRATVWRR